MPLTKVSAGIIAANAVSESIGSQAITGDKLGLTAINANNIVGASITGDKLVDSIAIANTTTISIANFLGPIFEKANITTTGGLTDNVTINVSSSSVLLYTANSSANANINFTGLGTAMAVGNVATYAVMVSNNTSPKYISNVQIDGVSVTPKWSGGSPTTGTSANTDMYTFSIFKTSATPTYNVFAQVSSFF